MNFETFMGKVFKTVIVILIFAGAFYFPVFSNYFFFFGNNPTVNVEYQWTRPNEIMIAPTIQSSIPKGYSLYVYRAEPTDRFENGFTIPANDQWKFVDFATGLGAKMFVTVNHTEIIEAVCVRNGTDPRTAFAHDSLSLDTSDTVQYGFILMCH